MRESRAALFTVKAMEAVKILEMQPEGLPGVEGAERSEGGGGNWGASPAEAGSRCPPASAVL